MQRITSDGLGQCAIETQARISTPSAVDQFLKKIRPHVQRASARAMERYPSKRRDVDVDDLTQVACTKIWRSLATYDPKKGRFSTWVGAIVQHAWFEMLGAAHDGDCIDIDDEAPRAVASLASAVDDQVAARISVRVLEAALPRPTHELVLRYGAGCSLKELAIIQGAKMETTKSRLTVARAKIGEILNDVVSVGCVIAA
jgi:RNA polymerase sigma factor (sigma-70 family)